MRFHLEDYRRFVSGLVSSGYGTLSFADPAARSLVDRNLLLRHDIDMDPSAALRMAETEHSVGARSTYYVLLSNRHTNPFDMGFRRSVQRITELGHWIGLHFDATQYELDASSPEFNGCVASEAAMLSEICDVHVESVSFHRPARDLLGAAHSLTAPLTHTYEHVFIREIEYCSDSSGRWAYGPPNERTAVQQGLPFHFLTHPISWGEDDRSPAERMTAWMTERVRFDHSYELPDVPNPFGAIR